MRNTKPSRINTKKLALLLLCAILIVGTTVVVLRLGRPDSGSQATDNTTNSPNGPESSTNKEEATRDEASQVNNQKEKVVDGQKTSPAGSNVTPIITFADFTSGQLETAGIVPEIFEEGGSCTYEATKGSSQHAKQSTATTDGRSVTCPAVTFSGTELGSTGSWSIMLAYKSAKYSGNSKPQSVEVQ